jgi:hypothetical protein
MRDNIEINLLSACRSAVRSGLVACVFIICSAIPSTAQEADFVYAQRPPSERGSINTVIVPAGTQMRVRMIDSVDSETNRANDRFRGVLVADFMAGDILVAPMGTTVYGRLLTAEAAGGTAGGELELDITEILLDNVLHSLRTSSKEVQGAEGRSIGGSAAKGAAAGGVAGAVLGAGAGFGARAGAVIAGVSGANARGGKVSVPAGSYVDFTLEHPVTLPSFQR